METRLRAKLIFMTEEKPDNQDQKPTEPQQQQRGPVLRDTGVPKAQAPALFLIIIALVILFGLFVGSRRTDTVIVKTDRAEVLREARSRTENKPQAPQKDIPMMDIIKQTAPLPDQSGN